MLKRRFFYYVELFTDDSGDRHFRGKVNGQIWVTLQTHKDISFGVTKYLIFGKKMGVGVRTPKAYVVKPVDDITEENVDDNSPKPVISFWVSFFVFRFKCFTAIWFYKIILL